jgi:hypothetical protein
MTLFLLKVMGSFYYRNLFQESNSSQSLAPSGDKKQKENITEPEDHFENFRLLEKEFSEAYNEQQADDEKKSMTTETNRVDNSNTSETATMGKGAESATQQEEDKKASLLSSEMGSTVNKDNTAATVESSTKNTATNVTILSDFTIEVEEDLGDDDKKATPELNDKTRIHSKDGQAQVEMKSPTSQLNSSTTQSSSTAPMKDSTGKRTSSTMANTQSKVTVKSTKAPKGSRVLRGYKSHPELGTKNSSHFSIAQISSKEPTVHKSHPELVKKNSLTIPNSTTLADDKGRAINYYFSFS